jgi:hypothetical protein
METRYEICDDDGVFRMPRAEGGKMLAEILMVDFIHHLEATAMGPLIIVRRSAADSDQEDPVLSILARYGIASDPQRTRRVRHHQCRSAARPPSATGPSCAPRRNYISSAEAVSWADVP